MAYALISVSDKSGVISFAKGLVGLGFQVLSTGGTFKVLQEAGVPAVELAGFTGHPEMLDGRVKTLHPKVHAGLLYRRDAPAHSEAMKAQGYPDIDVVAVNLYPFEAVVAKADCRYEHGVENIDIGGPSMLRSAAKNHHSVYVVADPADYARVLESLQAPASEEALALRKALALKVFRHTAAYDAAIAGWLMEQNAPEDLLPDRFGVGLTLHQTLRYGENPHQKAGFYRLPAREGALSFAEMVQHQGKELSFNNLLDLDSAIRIVLEFQEPAAVVIKHTNPTGVAIRPKLVDAYITARDVDAEAAFGSIMAFNRPVDEETAQELVKTFIEAVAAPGFSEAALAVLGGKKKDQKIRLLSFPETARSKPSIDLKAVFGGFLAQAQDTVLYGEPPESKGPRAPSPEEARDLNLAWAVVKHVKSNAIVLARDGATVGTGAGQMSRVASLDCALKAAGDRSKGAVLASDAFFPFRDSIDLAHSHGVTAVIQPGGSIRDPEVIQAVHDHNMAMLFTGMRHFRH